MEKSMSKWRELLGNPSVKRDMRGPVDFPVRLYIDPVLAVADFQRVGTELRDSKVLQDHWKPKTMSADTREEVMGELTRGHQSFSCDTAAHAAGQVNLFAEPLPSDALTQLHRSTPEAEQERHCLTV